MTADALDSLDDRTLGDLASVSALIHEGAVRREQAAHKVYRQRLRTLSCNQLARYWRAAGDLDLANRFANEAHAHAAGYFDYTDRVQRDAYQLVRMFSGQNGLDR